MLYPLELVMQARANNRAELTCRWPGSVPDWTTLRPGGERVIATGTLGDRRVRESVEDWENGSFGANADRGYDACCT